MKYFGARYYHATSARWISADSALPHAHDPQSLNKYTYVRNDPVNFVDPDGRRVCRPDGEGDYYCEEGIWVEPPPPSSVAYGRGDAARCAGGNCGGSAMGIFKLSSEKLGTLAKIAESGPCKEFLEALIKELGPALKGDGDRPFDLARLLEDIENADIENKSLGTGRYEHVEGNLIQMAPGAYQSHFCNYGTGAITSRPGDEFTIYLHAGFHLAMTSSSGQPILDPALHDAVKAVDRGFDIPVPDILKNALNGLAFATYCGPNAVPRPPRPRPD